ncbi:hypothetical protein [Streptomyces sp. GbtcB6]|uniref:hypothetical protein n=1 Tax=Streptomyces sp. GbtcB6 TaxID=2824751 RepID=UPI001C2FEDB9|nr:hypothetical protein [Streptomyces sp. GbtcB6]
MAVIDNEDRANTQQSPARPRYRPWLRPVLVTSALAVTVITGAVVISDWDNGNTTHAGTPNPVKSVAGDPGSSATAQQNPPVGKLRGFETVKDLTAAADLVVQGTVVAASGSTEDSVLEYQVEKVLYAADGSRVAAGDRINVTQLDPGIADSGQMSRLEPGQRTVLYLGFDGEDYSPLSGDFGIFDVTGDTATARSAAMSVRGLRTADGDLTPDNKFTTSLADLKSVAQERAAGEN